MLIDVLVLLCGIWFMASMVSCHKEDKERWNELDKRYDIIIEVVDTITDRNKELEQQNKDLVEFVENLINDKTCNSTIKFQAKLLMKKVLKGAKLKG